MESNSGSREQGEGTLEDLMRERIRATIETIVDEELEAALGAAPSQRVGPVRVGYRHGKRPRTLTTSPGATTIAMARARVEGADGRRREWRSRMIARYQRRTGRVDEAILGIYLSGTNTRRLRGALSPLLRGAPLSKDAVSRLVGRLREDFAAWAGRGRTSRRGPAATWARSRSVTCFWTAGIRGCGSGKSGCGCRCWSRWECVRTAAG